MEQTEEQDERNQRDKQREGDPPEIPGKDVSAEVDVVAHVARKCNKGTVEQKDTPVRQSFLCEIPVGYAVKNVHF